MEIKLTVKDKFSRVDAEFTCDVSDDVKVCCENCEKNLSGGYYFWTGRDGKSFCFSCMEIFISENMEK